MSVVHIIGAGGFGREVLQYIQDLRAAGRDLTPAGFVDDALRPEVCGLPVAKLEEVPPSPDRLFIIAVGDPIARRRLAARATQHGCRFMTLVHPLAYVAPSAELGTGCLISPFAFVGPSARIGNHVALNVHATADHDVSIEPFSYLAPYACAGGGAKLGEAVALGAHSSVAPGATVSAGERLAPGTHLPAR
jgi:sugar O-acyltransferase (sialic acid O-acetyltransferase NeuD family)